MQTFNCPSCGGTLEFDGRSRTVQCSYCGTIAEVPEALWQPASQARFAQQAKNWIVIFLIATVVLPTCFSLVGTALGIGGGLLGIFVPFITGFLQR